MEFMNLGQAKDIGFILRRERWNNEGKDKKTKDETDSHEDSSKQDAYAVLMILPGKAESFRKKMPISREKPLLFSFGSPRIDQDNLVVGILSRVAEGRAR